MKCFKKYSVFVVCLVIVFFIKLLSEKPKIENIFATKELVYKTFDDNNLKIDVYEPKDSLETHPAIIYIHGGSWISGSKKKVLERYRNYAVETLLKTHFVIISVDYRLIRLGYHLEDCIEDCISAQNFCIENAGYLKIDTSKIGLWGSSAGAHLGLLSYVFSRDNKIKFIISDFAPCDISEMWAKVPKFFRKQFSTFFYRLDEKNVEKFDSLSFVYSPINYAEKIRKIPVLISHGTLDRIVAFSESQKLSDSLKENCQFFSYEGLGHGFKSADSLVIKLYAERMVDFIKKGYTKN